MEYVLMKRHLADELLPKYETESSKLRPTYKFSSPNISPDKSNPDIGHLIDIIFELKNRHYASSILKYFENEANVSYDEHGNITNPATGLNVFDLIKYFVSNRAEPSIKLKIKNLYNILRIPSKYIRNIHARKYLSGEMTTSTPLPPLQDPQLPPLSIPSTSPKVLPHTRSNRPTHRWSPY